MATSTERSNKTHARQRAATLAADRRAVSEAKKIDLSDPRVEFAAKCYQSPRFFIENCLSVIPLQGGEVIPFRLNPGQKVVVEEFERQLAENRPIRIIVLKSRRQGISTLCEALVYWATSTRPYLNGMVVAHRKENAGDIFRIAKRFYDTDFRHKIPGLMPQIQQSNEKALRFGASRKEKELGKAGLESSMLVETAEGNGVAVGQTLQVGHFSEVAKWVNPAIMAGLGIALSKRPGTIGVMESTAEGVGNIFETTWTAAKNGLNEWAPVFLPWSIDPNCRVEVSELERQTWEWQSQEEKNLAEKNGLSLEQMKWRRQTIASPDCFRPGVRPEDVFRQEYPLTPEEAFLTSGDNFFLPEGVLRLRMAKGPQKPLRNALIVSPTATAERDPRDWKPLKPVVRSDDYGPLSIWEEPVPGEDYVIGADVAEGLAHGDFSVAWVLRRSNLAFVARLRTRKMDPDLFGQSCGLLGWYYNTALVGIEANGPGVSANAGLRRVHYSRYWVDQDVTKLNVPVREIMGWRTSAANRRTILDRVEEEIRNLTFRMPGAEFFEESRFFKNIDGKPQAIPGHHDDEIMTVAITLQLHVNGGAIRKPKEKERFSPEVDYLKPKAKEPSKKGQIRSIEWF